MIKTILTSAIFGLILTGIVSADVPRVVTDIPPTHSLVAQVMGGVGIPDLVVRSGESPHGYAMRPSDAAFLEGADLVFWISDNLTPWLESALETLATDAKVVELLETESTSVLSYRKGAIFEAHGQDVYEDGQKGDGDHYHDEKIDPHGWLDPENGKAWLDLIAAELSSLDPFHASLYFKNAAQGKSDIDAAVSQIEVSLEPFRGTNFIVFHDAYQYFEKRFDLQARGAISISDTSSPSPTRIAEIHQTVAKHGVACVFSEPQFNPGLVASVIGGTKVNTAVIDPLGSQLTTGRGFYPNLLRSIAQNMVSCL